MNQLGIFAKYWQPGSVKTRLAATVGELRASEIYREFVVSLLRRLQNIGQRRVIMFTPESHRSDFETIAGDDWELEPQTEGNLGARMHHYFETAFSRQASQVVLIGSDSPTMPLAYLQEAFQLLETHRVVLGPTSDGGYYLVGASGGVPPIFENITWSTPDVWHQTVEQIKKNDLPFAVLPPWYDVDDRDDLDRLREELSELVSQDREWGGLLQAASVDENDE